MEYLSKLWKWWSDVSLVKQIIIGLVLGTIAALTFPNQLAGIKVFGTLFVSALKSVAPMLVFFLVMSAVAHHKEGYTTNLKTVVILYMVGTLLASLTGVCASFIYSVKLNLVTAVQDVTPPSGVVEVLEDILMTIVENPVKLLMNADYIGILTWAILIGLALKHGKESSKDFIHDMSEAFSFIVRLVIRFAPLGVMGLVFNSIVSAGLSSMLNYGKLALQLVVVMSFVALVVNPIIAWFMMRKNPYPLVFTCLKDSGITAFFTRSSAANIPINMGICERLGLDKNTYAISIPLGATVNMAGAAVTISTLTLAAVNTLEISVDFPTALILSILAAVSACGASGVAGGSLLLIPLACSLFGIPNDIAMEVVGVGFIVGVIQDSCETALNSSTDLLFTAIADKKFRAG